MTVAEREPAVANRAYAAYGLTLASQIVLPELSPAPPAAAPDLEILRGRLPRPPGPGGYRFEADRATLSWKAVGTFLVEPGRIVADAAPGVEDDLLAFPLLGPVLAVALAAQGLFVLHASAVEMDGRAVVLMGDKGVGKSSTAGALVAAGHRLIADDLTAVRIGASGLHILPGFPQLKLSDAARAMLPLPMAQARPAAHPAIGKVRLRLSSGFAPDPVPTGRFYLLDRGGAAGAAPLPAERALPALVRHAYLARFGRAAVAGAAGARHLRQAAALAASGGVGMLRVPDGLDRIGDIVAIIARDLGAAP